MNCIECNIILTKYNTHKWGFRVSLGCWYLRFYRLCDIHAPRFLSISKGDNYK